MKLCLPLRDQPAGGMYSFYRHFRAWLETEGLPFTDDVEADYDVFVANSWAVPFATVLRAKRRPGVRVLHRMDGAARDYGRAGGVDRAAALVNALADVTVYQSAYARYATSVKHRITEGRGPVIYNAVDTVRFHPDGPRAELPPGPRLVNVAFSTNPMKGAARLHKLAARHPDVRFVFVGRRTEAPALPNVVDLGYLDWTTLPGVLRASDAFVTLSENEACPNVVLEALASGLPVLYHPSGGTPELVGPCGAPVRDEEGFRAAVAAVLARREALGREARARAVGQFAPGVVFPRYLAAAAAARPAPVPGVAARAWRRLRLRLALGAGRRKAATHQPDQQTGGDAAEAR